MEDNCVILWLGRYPQRPMLELKDIFVVSDWIGF